MYKKYNHTVGYNIWKLEWCTKYRYRIFAKFFMMIYCKVAVAEACKRHEIEILALKVMPEHVHMIASLPRGMTDMRALQLLKGFASRLLFLLCPDLRKRYPKGHLFLGSFAATVGETELEEAIDYVNNQEVHHAY